MRLENPHYIASLKELCQEHTDKFLYASLVDREAALSDYEDLEFAHYLTLQRVLDGRADLVAQAQGVFVALGLEYYRSTSFTASGETYVRYDGAFTVWAGNGWAPYDALTEHGYVNGLITTGLREFVARVREGLEIEARALKKEGK